MAAISSRNAESDNSDGAGPVSAATSRLLATANALDAEALAAPSLCAGWTRAHVLAHLARNADALTNLLTWARTGTETFMYASKEERDAGIERGASLPPEQLVDDLRTASERFATAVTELPADAWQHEVRLGPAGAGKTIPARRVVWNRLQEVEVHHVDLDADYSPDDWPDLFVQRALADALRGFSQRDDVPPLTVVADGTPTRLGSGDTVRVTGTARQVLAWLIGRTDGNRLDVEPAGHPLPELPPWM